METAPVPNQAYFCNDYQQNSVSDAKNVRVRPEEPIFAHAQLFVAAARVAYPQHLHFVENNSVSRETRNVVYRLIL